MLGAVFAVLSVVVVLAWLERRRRIRDTVEGRRPVVTDEQLREILEDGAIEFDRPAELDEEEIREAEDRFWDEADWDPPEEYHP